MVSARTAPDWTRLATTAAIILMAGFALSQAIALLSYTPPFGSGYGWGLDYNLYMERARSWLAGDGFYQLHQLTGPYPLRMGDATYPPVVLWLLVPFTVIPWPVWWIVPLGIIAAAIRAIRPTPAAWLVLAFVAVWPRTWVAVTLGNPSMWAFAALAAGLAWGWGGAFAAFKPTLGPFALWGANRRSWWIGAGLFVLLCIPFGTMWFDYATAMRNAQMTEQFGLGYIVGEWPIAAGLIMASWLSRR